MKSVLKFLFFIIMPSPSLHADALQFSFDSLFPSTPFKQVMVTVSQLRSSVHSLESYRGSTEDYEVFGDLIVGRLVNLNAHIDVMLTDKGLVHGDDIEYLLMVIDFMKQEMKTIFDSKACARGKNIEMMIGDIKRKLEKVIV